MAKLGRINLVNEKESTGASVEITSNPVEKGIPLSDHVKRSPETLTVSGFLLGNSANNDYEWLKKQAYEGKLITYTGRKVFKNVLIEDIKQDLGEYKNGFAITVQLKEIRIAKTPFVKKKVSGKKAPAPKKKPTTKKYHKVKRGETYSHMRMWYGTSLNQLRAWNKYPDRRIPIGVKLRVK